MKSFLRQLLNWLDRKFPDKIIVTVADYLTLKAQIETLTKIGAQTDEWAKKQSERISKLESEITKLNVGMGFNVVADKLKMGAFQR